MAKSHPAGMHICYATFAGISLRLCSISLRSFRITFAAYLPTHIKSLWDFFQSLQNNHRDNLYIISIFFRKISSFAFTIFFRFIKSSIICFLCITTLLINHLFNRFLTMFFSFDSLSRIVFFFLISNLKFLY